MKSISEILERLDTKELLFLLEEWLTLRNSLSSDCQKLGISGHIKDSARWGQELSNRCEKLRFFLEVLFSEKEFDEDNLLNKIKIQKYGKPNLLRE